MTNPNYADADTSQMPENTEPESKEESTEPTAVLPRSFFEAAGKEPKPGDTCKVRVLSSGEDSIEVAYEKAEEAEPEPEMPRGGRMAAMME